MRYHRLLSSPCQRTASWHRPLCLPHASWWLSTSSASSSRSGGPTCQLPQPPAPGESWAPQQRLRQGGQWAAGRAIARWWSGSIGAGVSGEQGAGGAARHRVRGKTGWAPTWSGARSIPSSCCLPPIDAQLWLRPCPTTGPGSARVWRPGTPAMAAAWTAHVWALTAGWLYRGPPGPQAPIVSARGAVDHQAESGGCTRRCRPTGRERALPTQVPC